MISPLSILPFMSRIYEHCDPQTQTALHKVSKLWNHLPAFIQFRAMAERRVIALNDLLGLKGNSIFEYNLTIEHIQMDLVFYKFRLLSILPKKKAGYAFLPIELAHPFSSLIQVVSLASIRYKLIKTLPKFLKGAPEECIDYMSSSIVKNLNSSNPNEACLLLDFTRSVKAFDRVFPKVMNSLVEKNDYKEAIFVLTLVFRCPSLADKKQEVKAFLQTMQNNIENRRTTKEKETALKQGLLVAISEILKDIEPTPPIVEEEFEDIELNDSEKQSYKTSESLNEPNRDDDILEFETSDHETSPREAKNEIHLIKPARANDKHFEEFKRQLSVNVSSETQFEEMNFDYFRTLATLCEYVENRKLALEILLGVLKGQPIRNFDWIDEIEKLLNQFGYDSEMDEELNHPMPILLNNVQNDDTLPPNKLLERIRDLNDGDLRDYYFEKFYEFAIIHNHLDVAFDLILSINEVIEKDEILVMLWNRLKISCAMNQNDSMEFAKNMITSCISDPSLLQPNNTRESKNPVAEAKCKDMLNEREKEIPKASDDIKLRLDEVGIRNHENPIANTAVNPLKSLELASFEMALIAEDEEFSEQSYDHLKDLALRIPIEADRTQALQSLLKTLKNGLMPHPDWIEELEKFLGIYTDIYDDEDYYPQPKIFAINNIQNKQDQNAGSPEDWLQKIRALPPGQDRDYFCYKFFRDFAIGGKNLEKALRLIQLIENAHERDELLIMLYGRLKETIRSVNENETDFYEFGMALVGSCITNPSLLTPYE